MDCLKTSLVQNITTTGIILTGSVANESKVRFVVSNAAGGNTVVVRGRIVGQDDWDTLDTLTANNKVVVNVITYDEIQIECSVYSSLSNYVRVVASSFNDAGGSTTIDAPAGGSVSGEEITFTSSDMSISITADPLTNTIDFIALGGSGGLSKYSTTFNNTSDWTLNAGFYEYTVLAATHGNKPNPVVETYETIAGDDFEISPTIVRNSGNDIILQVTQIPDNRYTGRIIIL